jgi:TctA family transporter
MEIIDYLVFGFSHALTIHNLVLCATGCVIGMLVGLLPGLGPLATISLLLPLTFSLPATGALIMLDGIYYGGQYGDNVSAITMKIPHASSIVACIDGYQMTLKGKTGVALFSAGVSSFIGGTVAILVLAWLAGVAVRPSGVLRAGPLWVRLRQLGDDWKCAGRPGDVLRRGASRTGRYR